VRVGAPDSSLTPNSGLAAVGELTRRLGVVEAIDAAVGPIKTRDRGCGVGGLLVGLAAAQLAGEAFLVGLDRQRADLAGQQLTPVPGLSATTAAGLARRVSGEKWRAVETGLAAVNERVLALGPAARRAALTQTVTVDIDATDVEVYGRKKRGVAYNYAGQRCGRPHVAIWAQTEIPLAADLLAGDEDPRPGAAGLLRRALAALPAPARACADIAVRVDAGYFAGELARAARTEQVRFAIGAKRIAPLWRLLDGLDEQHWTDAIDMHGAQVAVADYAPTDWPEGTRLLIRRVRLDASEVSTDPRSRRRRTLHPDQRVLPIDELAEAGTIYAYSFILTDLDCSSGPKAAAVEHWYRRRTSVENVFRDGKHGAALRHLPSGYPEVNTAWMWGALLAAGIAGWLHELTGATSNDGRIAGHGIRQGKAMIATLRHRLIAVPARLARHAGQLTVRLPPGHGLLAAVLARIRALPALS
jgi:hypothetical protein